MDTWSQDLRFAARQLFKDRGFLIIAASTLAICIGANTAIFSVVRSVIFQPLEFPESERLVTMWNAYPAVTGDDGTIRGSNGVPDYYDRRALEEIFEELAAYRTEGFSLELEDVAQRVQAMAATPSLFDLLRAEAAIGRVYTEAEQEERERVVMLSHGLWRQLGAGNSKILGQQLRIDGELFTVVGVMPEGFTFLDPEVRFWIPARFDPERRHAYHSNNWSMVARLQPEVSLQQAQARIDGLNTQNLTKMPDLAPLLKDAGFHTPVYFLAEDLVRDVRSSLFLLWGGVGFVLLIGCVNVANLSLVRASGRSKELAMRFALGAGRARVARQMLTESLLISGVGGLLGLALGALGLRAITHFGGDQLPRGEEIHLDGTAFGFTALLIVGVALVVALIPVATVLRLQLSSVFRAEGRGGTAHEGLRNLRKGLVVTQIGLALVLLVGAGLLVASFQRLMAIDPGFERQGVLTASLELTSSRYPEDADVVGFVDRLLQRMRSLPGVQATGATNQIPFGGGFSDSVIFAEGYQMKPGESAVAPSQNVITPGYFDTMGMPMVRGRDFDDRDRADTNQVIVIDELLANHFWPDEDPVGRRMWMPGSAENLNDMEKAEFFEIVGVVSAIRLRDLTSSFDLTGACYFPWAQRAARGVDLALHTSGDPLGLASAVRGAMAELDPQVPVFDLRTMDERVDRSLASRQIPMMLASSFGAVALLLAAVGLYGVLAYLVQLRTREIGIRVALGGDRSSIFALVLREGALIIFLGLGAGLLGAFVLRQWIASQLYGVTPLDPSVLLSVAGILTLVGLIACLVPARRATRVDPVVALSPE